MLNPDSGQKMKEHLGQLTLKEFINYHYNGNVCAYARANGFIRQQVEKNIERGYIYVLRVEGDLKQVSVKRDIVEP